MKQRRAAQLASGLSHGAGRSQGHGHTQPVGGTSAPSIQGLAEERALSGADPLAAAGSPVAEAVVVGCQRGEPAAPGGCSATSQAAPETTGRLRRLDLYHQEIDPRPCRCRWNRTELPLLWHDQKGGDLQANRLPQAVVRRLRNEARCCQQKSAPAGALIERRGNGKERTLKRVAESAAAAGSRH
jgi:hypothetical protein